MGIGNTEKNKFSKALAKAKSILEGLVKIPGYTDRKIIIKQFLPDGSESIKRSVRTPFAYKFVGKDYVEREIDNDE